MILGAKKTQQPGHQQLETAGEQRAILKITGIGN